MEISKRTGKSTLVTLKKKKQMGQVITFESEAVYMAAVGQDHRDYCSILINTAMKPGSAAELVWSDVHFGAVAGYRHGFILNRLQKAGIRACEIGMTSGLAAILRRRWMSQGRPASSPVFPANNPDRDRHKPLSSFQSNHRRLWLKTANSPSIAIPRFRLQDFRHTALTRAIEIGI